MFERLSPQKCACGKEHIFSSKVIIEKGAINKLLPILEELDLHSVFVFADKNTYSAAGQQVVDALEKGGIQTKKYVYSKDILEPNEANVGLAIMNFDPSCDAVIAVGSGVINDICKIVANVANKKYIIIGTAPSMDGYASATSSMTMDGLKISLNSKCADVIVGDIDVLCNAPVKMMVSGLGDMLAKYVSICEWRISNLINEEYYCEDVAALVRRSLKKCVDNAEGLLSREENAVKSVFEGLIICGAAMKFAGTSRPASGIEHYLSHIWDMRGIAFGTSVESHGIQCAIGTLISIRLYEKVKNFTPSKEQAIGYVEKFDFDSWSEELRQFLGNGSQAMIALEKKEQKYDKAKHTTRLETIIDKWAEIRKIIEEELPSSSYIENLLQEIGAPKTLEEIGLNKNILPMTLKSAKDIRDKYVLPKLLWDLGMIDVIF